MKRLFAIVCISLGLLGAAAAQEFPAKPVRVVVPFPPGGGTDVVTRLFAQRLTELWKQSVIADNKPGANTIIGSDAVAKSPGDGYSWLVASPSHTVNVSLYAGKIPYDTDRDFMPVSMLASGPLVILANPSLPVSNVKELIELARRKPGSIRYGSAGNGSSPHLAAAMFAQMAGVNIEHVPYKGTAPAIADVMSGQIEITFQPLPGMQGYIDSGKLKALAVTTEQRFSSLPNLPTLNESGLKGFNLSQWWGIVVPKGTPQAVIQRIDAGIKEIQARPDVRKTLLDMGAEVNVAGPAQLAAHIRRETSDFKRLIETARITID